MTVYSPASHQSLYEVGGAFEKLYGTDKLAADLNAGGHVSIAIAAVAPATNSLWLDTGTAPGVLKYHNGAAWVAMSKAGTLKHLWNNGSHNFAATTNPALTSDSASGYAVGSFWFNVTLDVAYVCLDASAGAAVWLNVTSGNAASVSFSPSGNIAATDVQNAIVELDTEKADKTVTVTAGGDDGLAVTLNTLAGPAIGLSLDITGTTAETVIADGDEIIMWDVSAGALRKISRSDFLANWQFKNNTGAAAPPTATDDSAAGYSVGSMWVDTVGDESYRLVDATATAAVWVKTTLGTDELGSMALQNSTAVSITGGTITGITDMAVLDGGTGASTALAAFDNLKQAATDIYVGAVELSTNAEAIAGTDTVRAVTPANLAAVLGGATVLAGGDDGLLAASNDLVGNIGLAVDITGTTVVTTLAAADEFLIWDVSAAALRKITVASFFTQGTAI